MTQIGKLIQRPRWDDFPLIFSWNGSKVMEMR